MNVAVTGGAGFIGANLCRRLRVNERFERIVVVDDLSSGSVDNLAGIEAIEVLEGTVLDAALLDRALGGVDTVVHLAARGSVPRSVRQPMAAHHANVTGTAEVLEAARRAGGPHVVVASSSSVYGNSGSLPTREDQAPAPASPYAATKLATEAYALAWAAVYDLPLLALRFFNVFGPLQEPGHSYAAVVPAFISAAIEGRPLPVHGDGRQTRDFTFVDTVCTVLEASVVDRVSSPGPVNLAFGSRVSLLELVGELEQVLGRSLTVEHQRSRPGDVRDTQADGTRLRALFPEVRPVGLRDGLQATLEWFQRRS